MDLTLTICIYLATFLIAYVFLWRPRNLPPGPVALPWLGSVSALRQLGTRSAHLVFCEFARKYGNIMSIQLGSQLIVVLSGYDTIYEALVKRAEVFSDRMVRRYLPKNVKHGILTSDYNDHWKVLRKFTSQALRDFGVGTTSLETKVAVEIDTVGKHLLEANGKPIVIRELFQKLTANVIYGIIFGIRYDYDDPKFKEPQNVTNVVIQGPGPMSLNNYLPAFVVRFFDKEDFTITKSRLQGMAGMGKHIRDMIEEHQATFDNENIRDFVDLYIRTSREENPDEQDVLTAESISRVVADLFVAGAETVYATLDWAFLLLAEFPEVQHMCQAEIEQVVGAKYIEYSDHEALPYVEATILEIMRLAVTVPLSVPHYVKTDTELGGYNIPANTIVIPNLYSASVDDTIWKEPAKFNPSRFIDESGKLRRDDKVILFSLGPRVCLGEPLARMELFLVVTNLLQRFRFERESPDVRHSLESVPRQITRSPLPYKLRVFSR